MGGGLLLLAEHLQLAAHVLARLLEDAELLLHFGGALVGVRGAAGA